MKVSINLGSINLTTMRISSRGDPIHLLGTRDMVRSNNISPRGGGRTVAQGGVSNITHHAQHVEHQGHRHLRGLSVLLNGFKCPIVRPESLSGPFRR